ncbi:MAG: 3-deoxy-8-phosphooctulonate synthase [Planctomycetota bacterium]
MKRIVTIGPHRIVPGKTFFVIAGPCVVESPALCREVAGTLAAATRRLGIPLIFKASYDKANRTSAGSFRGPGLAKGLSILADIRRKFGIPVTTDVHQPSEVTAVARVADLLQIPAFLCRQTDLLVAAGKSGKPVNIKKGQFLAPWDMAGAVKKVEKTGNRNILLTERGTTFGYNNLVSDMRSIPLLAEFGYPVVYDGTHSVQKPGGLGERSGGDRSLAPVLMKAAVAAGADGIFFETHPDPDRAKSDGPNMIPLDEAADLLAMLVEIRKAIRPS